MQLRKPFADFAHAVLRHRQPNAWFWIALWVVFVLIAAAAVSIKFWCWLRAGESSSTTIRNLGLVIAAIAALTLAIWRSKVLAVRLGGIYALALLACEHPGDYHMQIMSLLYAFVRHPTAEAGEAAEPINGGSMTMDPTFKSWGNKIGFVRPLRAREDIQAVMTAVHERSGPQIKIEKEEEYRLNLSGANLAGAYLGKCVGLTQGGLDLAASSTDTPPNLTNVIDADTGEPLW